MKKRFTVLLFLLFISTGAAWAEVPVSVTHTLTGYSMGTELVILNYTLTVKNLGAASISNLTLSYVPVSIISKDALVLDIGTLDANGQLQFSFSLATPMLLDQAQFSGQPLFWSGKFADGNGSTREFPASSAMEVGVL